MNSRGLACDADVVQSRPVRIGSPGLDDPDWAIVERAKRGDREAFEELVRSVGTLRLKYRAPLVLRDVEGLSTVEAAAILGLSEAAFKSRLHRARVALHAALEAELASRPAGRPPGATQ